MIEASSFKRGMCLKYRDAPMQIVHVSFSTPTARGGTTLAKTRLRNLLTGQLLNESIRSGEKFEEVDLERHDASFMYSDGTRWHFMDNETYEQFDFGAEELGDAVGYLVDGLEKLQSVLIEGNVVSVELPDVVEMNITETDPAIKGATAKAQLKPATLETGLVIQVPPYLVTGERIRVDTRDARFVERANK
jgi:elongation factor P